MAEQAINCNIICRVIIININNNNNYNNNDNISNNKWITWSQPEDQI